MPDTFIVDRPTETTHQKIAAALEVLASDARRELSSNWQGLAELADSGLFGMAYGIGDRFVDTWKDTATNAEYTYPYQLNHIGNVELEDAETLSNRPFLQAHFAHPFGVQFSHQRAFLRCPSGLAAGTYYFTIESNWRVYVYSADGKTVLETITPTFTASGTSLGTQKLSARNGDLNSTQEMAYGWNRWKTSAIRQYLNSSAGVGGWWTAQDEWDIMPDELTTKAGFLSGCPEEFVNAIKAIKVVTYPNTVYDDTGGNTPDITYDKVFLPSLEQIFVTPQKSGEGEYHEYWKRRSGSSTPLAQGGTYPNMITYAVENHSSPQNVRLRSANRGSASHAWAVSAVGNVGNHNASFAIRFSPLVVL